MNTILTKEEKKSAAFGAFLFLIPLFMKTKTEFVVFYMKQNFGIFVSYIVFHILLKILVEVVFLFSGGITAVSNSSGKGSTMFMGFFNIIVILFSLIGLALFVLAIFLIVKAYKGEKYEVPYLYRYTDLIISKLPFLQKIFSVK